ncbi:anhydro-N-acetylmuramic acid kinase [Isoptericola sp. BMS4]|uniref:anhydro-N-acetylmuramic acid kinase n=1 Tax=Isoptericola sp. BMS4 TaxID=2527875 RepID=UPI0014238C8A|nr:anhydro-N-acetylmuramic acid kinase [Isoptericola sp. BMS4]
MIVVGLMTGTSADGLDVAVADLALDGDELALRVLDHREVAFPDDLADDILRLLEPRDVPLSLVSGVDARLGRFCADAVADVLAETGVVADLVVSHGQTVRHDVTDGQVTGTFQIGQPAWIAERTGVPVLSDVRSHDVAAGGQGAPLASVLDHLLLADAEIPTAALNLGGIANITVVAPGRPTVAYDTGPANALIDLMARRITGEPRAYDRDGALAAAGEVLPALLDDLLAEPYYALDAPKSTGKELFHAAYLDEHLSRYAAAHGEPDPHDVVATLTVLTARTVVDQCRARGVGAVVASGGGTRNPVLMAALRRELGAAPVRTTDELGLPEGAKEATLMALLGWLTWHGLPGTLPGVTGATHGTLAGRITPGAGPLRLGEPPAAPPARLRVVR